MTRRSSWQWWPLAAVAGLVGACIDPAVAPAPVVMLRAPASAVQARAGGVAALAVQAVDVQGKGVNGALVTFVRPEAPGLSFDGLDPSAEAAVATTASAELDGVLVVGVASVRALVASDAPPGDTSAVAVVKTPTSGASAAVSVRIAVRIGTAEPPDGGDAQSAIDAVDDGEANNQDHDSETSSQ